jgi:subtilase-type serine protease
LAALAFLTACKHSSGPQITSSLNLVDKSELKAFYVASFAPFEAAAANLRNNNPQYTVQKFPWRFDDKPPTYNIYSLSNANVEYAHAVGLTGAGQLIAVVDAGFLQSHLEFAGAGKIITPGGANAPDVHDHGTTVAAIAAGSANSGQTIGVAPGASLHLGSFDSFASMIAATRQANALGAIVQNNSWGYKTLDATTSDYNLAFGSAQGKAYISNLKQFAKTGVIVFAASNNVNRKKSDLMAGLPNVVTRIKRSWITAVNAVPTFAGNKLKSATLISSGCLDAAAWCMAADGTVYGAVATGINDYELGTGSSFAAPQISGAVAILAEAFPTLNAKEIRARLLASANNSFYKHSGYVKFAPGIKHGYGEKYGHGFLDLKAALLPIGAAFVPVTSGRSIPVNQPVILSGGMSGNAVSKRLAKYDLVFVDGMGGGFKASANMLTAEIKKVQDVRVSLGALLATDLNNEKKNPFDTTSIFSSLVAGQEMNFDVASTNFAVLLPSNSQEGESFGIAFRQKFDLGQSALSLGFNAMREADGFVGMKSLLNGEHLGSTHGAATVEWAIPLISRQEVRLSGSLGIAVPDGNISTMSLSSVNYNSIGASYSARDVFGDGDRFSFGVNLPHVINSGSATFAIPVATRSSGKPKFQSVKVPLAASRRQMDLTVSYGLPMSERSEMIMTATHSLNSGNVAEYADSVAAVGWRFRF